METNKLKHRILVAVLVLGSTAATSPEEKEVNLNKTASIGELVL